MQRDMDLARQLLFRVEEHPEAWYPVKKEFTGLDADRVRAHTVWLCEAGLLCSDAHPEMLLMGYGSGERVRLTWAGCEFLDAARNETLWKRAKSTVTTVTGGLAFDLLKLCLMHEATRLLRIDS